MGFGELFLLAIGISMDAFAVSICKGLAVRKAGLREMGTCGSWFSHARYTVFLSVFYRIARFATPRSIIRHSISKPPANNAIQRR